MFRSGKFWSLGFFSRFVKGKEDCEGFAENLGFGDFQVGFRASSTGL